MSRLVSVILAGGCGRRLYPISSALTPKQFIRNAGHKTLFQETIDRLVPLTNNSEIVVVSGVRYRNNILTSLTGEQRNEFNLVFEPCQRNDFAASIAGVMVAREKFQDPIILVSPCDLVFSDNAEFHDTVTDIIANFNDNIIYYINNQKQDHLNGISSSLGVFLCRASKFLEVALSCSQLNYEQIFISLKKSIIRQNEININYEDYSAVSEYQLDPSFFAGKLVTKDIILKNNYIEINDFDDFFNYYQEDEVVKIEALAKDVDTKSFNRLSAKYTITRDEQAMFLCLKDDMKAKVA